VAEGCNENSNGLLREFYPKKINNRRIDKNNLNTDKFKTKKIFKLCNTI